MKWSLVGLITLGFLAATSAVVLVVSMRQQPGQKGDASGVVTASQPTTTPVVVAAASLETRRVVRADDVKVTAVPRDAAPRDAFTDPVQVIGKVLVAPVAEGQAFVRNSFANEGSGLHLATTLQSGLRAYCVQLDDDLSSERLLYPGCFVDIVASIDVHDQDQGSSRERFTFTLLQGVMVLAVGDRSIVSPDKALSESTAPRLRKSLVTIAVTPEEASLVKLAEDEGDVALVLRNPFDERRENLEVARVASLFSVLGPKLPERRDPEADELQRERDELARERRELELARAALDDAAAEAPEQDGPLIWETVILRGSESSIKTFEVKPPSE